jgi:hypothetical protein
MPKQNQKDDDGNRDAEQPKQNCGHLNLLEFRMVTLVDNSAAILSNSSINGACGGVVMRRLSVRCRDDIYFGRTRRRFCAAYGPTPEWPTPEWSRRVTATGKRNYGRFLGLRPVVSLAAAFQKEIIALLASFKAAVCCRRTDACQIPIPVPIARFAALSHILINGFLMDCFLLHQTWRCLTIWGVEPSFASGASRMRDRVQNFMT